MANKLKSRRHKKRRIVSSKKRRQPKSRTKRYRRKTRKNRGGMKRAPSTPTQVYDQNDEPLAPRKNRTRAVDDAVVGVNLFEGFPGNEGYQERQEDQENINPQTQGVGTPQGNLNNALDQAYMESITTPQRIDVPRDLHIEPFGYDEHHNEIIDEYEAPNFGDEYYESDEEEEL